MRNHNHIPRVQMNKLMALFILMLIPPLCTVSQAQSLKIIATGTGQTTGHIATLSINNTTGSAVKINAQTCYIPSDGKNQPYVATIPATSVPTGTSQLQVEGYCADVFAQPVPDGQPMPLISTWIPVTVPGTNVQSGGTNLLTTPAVPAFKSENIPVLVQAAGYSPLPSNATSASMTTWPNTTIPFEGTIKPEANPKSFAPVLVEALNSITKAFDDLKQNGNVNTAYSSNIEKEREAVIQQTFWIYTAAITGMQYQKDQFHEKAIRQFEDNSGMKVESLSKEEAEKLASGIDVFWNTFINVSIDAKVLKGTRNAAVSTSAANSILPPWNRIELTDARMKPGNDPGGAHVFPWLPVIGGTVAAGAIAYFIIDGSNDDDDTLDCTFTASAIPSNSTCGLPNGRITVNVIPAGSYTYQWSNGGATQSIDNIPAGNYTVTVTRTGTNCSQVVSSTITNQNISFNATISSQNTDCDQPNGSVSVNPSPPGAYTYLWSNGATTQNQSNLPAGNYSVTISAGGSCERILSTQIGTDPFQPSVSFNTTPSTCGGSDGAATVLVNPPAQYNYNWSNGQTGSSVSGLAAGAYNVTVSKPGTSCSYVASVTVEDISASFSISISSTMSGCGLSNGTATATVNPPGVYEFNWSNGQTGPMASGLAKGLYTVTVSIPGTSCTEEASVTITEMPASFIVSLSSTPAGCGVNDGTVTATVNPPGAYTYQWSNGQSGAQLSGLAPGTYSVTVSLSGEDCTQQGSITVASTPFPYNITFNTTPASCGGSDGTSTVVLNPQGEVNYQWSNGQTSGQLSGVQAGTYTVTVTIPGTNCTKVATTTIDELPAAFTVSVTTTPAGCGINNGTATAVVDPPGSYTYAWSNGQTGSQLSGVLAGTYTVTVSITGTSCSKSTSATVEQLPPAFTLSFSSTPAGCGMNNGSATVSVTPPGSYTYLWSNGGTGMQINNVGSGTYSVTVTQTGTSCSTTGSVNVGQTGGGFTATFTTVNADCGLPNGSATISVSPPGEYTYLWSNQQTGIKLEQAAPGTYTVTVTDDEGCAESFSVTIGEDIAEYINILSVTPGTCAGGGDIRFTLTTPGAGPLEVDVTGPGGMNTFTVTTGVYNLSSLMMVLPGSYTITVIDQQIGPMCSETVSATVNDITPPIVLENDFFTAEGSTPLNENALTNDEGLNIQMTQVDNEVGGTVTFMGDGDFTFIADIGFSGEASFIYTVTDACGNTATAEVVIIVEEVPCDIIVNFESTPASCGLEDGSITVIVSGPGEYEYEWSTGDTGPTISNIPPGGYLVTITDLDIGCTYEDSYVLEGLPGNYIEDVVVINPTCESDGDIEFTAVSPGGNTLSMLVEHPFGAGEFDIEAGLIQLSDYVTTVPGEYFVEVSDPEAGPGCSQSFTVTINEPPVPVIEIVEIFPPSGPNEMDGSAFVQVITPGQLPYAVYVDGLFAFTVNQNNFFLQGLGEGVHTVYIVDIQGCESPTLEFFVPAGEEAFSFGISLSNAGTYSASNEQPTLYQPGNIWRSVFNGSYRFDVGDVQQVVRVLYAPEVRGNIGEPVNGFMAMEFLSGPQDVEWKSISMRTQAGFGTYVEQRDATVSESVLPLYWVLRASVEQRVFKRILLSGSISAGGRDYIAPVSWEFGVRVPFYNWKKSGGG
jgi:hypothetical protein